MNLFELLVMVHFIADWIFQSQRQANNKSKSLKVLIEHSFIYMAFFIPLLVIYGVSPINQLWVLALLFVSHCFFDNRRFELWLFEKIKGLYIVDGKPFYNKCDSTTCYTNQMEPFDTGLFWILLITIDQIFHIMVLAAIALIL